MARVVSEERGPRRGTVIPGEARLYSGDVDVTDAYVVEIAATGHVHVRRYWGDPPITHWSIDSPVFGHDQRHPIGPVAPDGSDLGLGPVILEPEPVRPASRVQLQHAEVEHLPPTVEDDPEVVAAKNSVSDLRKLWRSKIEALQAEAARALAAEERLVEAARDRAAQRLS